MIPIKLRITGFTSYRKPVEIDFSGFELACISGPNGAGKSSLLDAITYALYGEARKKDAAIINTAANKAEVQLDFEYEIAQKITRSLFEQGLISEEEQVRITRLNQETFPPLYKELIEI